MAITLAEAEVRIRELERVIRNAVNLPNFAIDLDDTSVTDKSNKWCLGTIEGVKILGYSTVANPTLLSDFSTILSAK